MSNHRIINIKINNPFSPESKLKRITRKNTKTLSRANKRTDKLNRRARKQTMRADYKLYKASKAFDKVAEEMNRYYGKNPDRFPLKKELEAEQMKNKPNAKFPDLSGDGKVTKKDILIGRGVIKKPKMLRNKRKDYV